MHFITVLNLVLPLAFLPSISAKCCSGGSCITWTSGGGPNPITVCTAKQCPDGTKIPSGFGCCGYRKCNIFCCNCDSTSDGKICREKPGRLVEEASTSLQDGLSDADMFSVANTAGNGNLTIDEFMAYVAAPDEDRATLEQKFRKFDRNGDGVLTVDEMRLPEGA